MTLPDMGWESENVGLSPVSDAPVNEHFLQCLAIGCVTALAIVRKLIELLVRAIHDQAEVNGGFTDCSNSVAVIAPSFQFGFRQMTVVGWK